MTIEDLDSSKTFDPRNPSIVRILEEKTDFFENRHTGIKTMKRKMKEHGLVVPEFEIGKDYFKVIFRNTPLESGQASNTQNRLNNRKNEQLSGQVGGQVSEHQNKLLEYCIEPKSTKEIREYLNINSRSYVREKIIKPLIDKGKLDYTNKNSKDASNQKYITIKEVK